MEIESPCCGVGGCLSLEMADLILNPKINVMYISGDIIGINMPLVYSSRIEHQI